MGKKRVDFVIDVRIFIARILDRLYPHACWAALVAWAFGTTDDLDGALHSNCHNPKEWGSLEACYCGKFPKVVQHGK